MFNLDDSFWLRTRYFFNEDLLLKSGVTTFGLVGFLELIRTQISEINLVQLIPGVYFLFFFFGFVSLSFFNYRFFATIRQHDIKREIGIKLKIKIQSKVLQKYSTNLMSSFLLLVLNSVIPISFDCFSDYSTKTIDNSWSFTEVLNLEVTLLIILAFLSQIPFYGSNLFLQEKISNFLPKKWKQILFFLIVISGSLTPTIDGNTQLSFACCTLTLFNLLLNLVQKRSENKSKEIYGC